MNKYIKKIVSILLATALLFCTLPSAVFATEPIMGADDASTQIPETPDEIMEVYGNLLSQVERNQNVSKAMLSQAKSQITAQRSVALQEAGYAVYELNQANYNTLSNALNTDLSEAGLSPSAGYLIVFEQNPDSEGMHTQSSGPSPVTFSYTYQGQTYMRTLYVYDDDSLAGGDFHQESHDDVTGTSNLTDILDKVITIASYAPGIGEILGNIWTFLTFTGIIGSFSGTYHGDDIIMFANTEWGRTYTQVWSSYDSAWIFGSCVERAICKSHLSGYIYKNSNYTKIEGQERSATLYSDKYANNTWKRSTAVSNYLNSVPCSFDITGDVEYTFENSVILTHDEPSYYP